MLRIKANQSFDNENKESFGGLSRFYPYDDPHLKAFFLLQAHLQRVYVFPVADYSMDTNSVLDQAIRILQAMVDISASQGFLRTTLGVMKLMQCIKQGVWPFESSLYILPKFTAEFMSKLKVGGKKITELFALAIMNEANMTKALLATGASNRHVEEMVKVVLSLPVLKIQWTIAGCVTDKHDCLHLEKNKDYTIKIECIRLRSSKYTHSPRFPKAQTEGWWMMLTEESDNEIHLLKRVTPPSTGQNFKGNFTTSMVFTTPDDPGEYTYEIMCISDIYVGFDAQVNVKFTIT